MYEINKNPIANGDLCLIARYSVDYAVYFDQKFYHTDANHKYLYVIKKHLYGVYKIINLSFAEKQLRDDILALIDLAKRRRTARLTQIIPRKDLIPNTWYITSGGRLTLYLGKGTCTAIPFNQKDPMFSKICSDPFAISIDEYQQYIDNLQYINKLSGYFYYNTTYIFNWLTKELDEQPRWNEFILYSNCNMRFWFSLSTINYNFVKCVQQPRKCVYLYKTNAITNKQFIWAFSNQVVLFDLQ